MEEEIHLHRVLNRIICGTDGYCGMFNDVLISGGMERIVCKGNHHTHKLYMYVL